MIKAEWTNKDSLDLQSTCNQLATVYKWERDIALSQLEEYGIGFAEKKRDDLVEIVRCKDCYNNVPQPGYDFTWCNYFFEYVRREHYCSYGERRE